MRQWQFHTPDGVSDLLPAECAAKRQLEDRIRTVFARRGYQELETPGIEFYDVYAAGGYVPQEGLFKFFDQQGRILSLRYDGTVPAARVAATLCQDWPLPLRLSYIGNMYRYDEYGGGRQREFGQAGIELMGQSSAESDAEVIATAIAAALACGIEDLQISLGQVAFYHGVLAEWQITGDDAATLPHLIDSKQLVALEELADRLDLPDRARQVMRKMASNDGSTSLVDELSALVSHPAALAALDNLRDVMRILADYDCLKYVSLDLGMLQSLNYYTGIIFKGFTYGLGFPLFSGGRYDGLVSAFGRDLSATGFSIGISLALTALQRQGKHVWQPQPPIQLGYAPDRRASALQLAAELRGRGSPVILDYDARSAEDLLTRTGHGAAVWLDSSGTARWLREES